MSHEDTPEVIEEITRVALDYRLMSQYTSFVAVDESEMPLTRQQATPPRQVIVPVPLPEGVNFAGIFGQLEEEPQFFYDLFGKELLDQNGEYIGGMEELVDAGTALAPSKGRRNGLTEDSFRGRYTEFAIGDSRRFLPTSPQLRTGGPKRGFPFGSGYGGGYGYSNALPSIDPARLIGFRAQASIVKDFEYVPRQSLPADGFEKQHTTAQQALVDAQALQKQGHLAEARLRYQHALALAADDTYTGGTAMQAIWTLNAEIAEKRAEVYPGLNRKLDVILRNQPVVDAMQTVVNAGGFQLEGGAGEPQGCRYAVKRARAPCALS